MSTWVRAAPGAVVALALGWACPSGAAQPINCSSEVSSQLVPAAGNQVQNYSCGLPSAGGPETGPDDVYEFTCQETGSVTLSLGGLDCDLDLYVLDQSCTSGAGCVGGGNTSGTQAESVSFSCVAGATYVVIVEGFGFEAASCAPTEGHYDLDVSPTAGSGCLEDCDNAADDDADGDIDCADSNCSGDPACGGPALNEVGSCPALEFLPGDINRDASFDVLDATIVRRELAGLGPGIAQTCDLRCGNGLFDPGEDCELGTALGETCESLGVGNQGTLTCAPGSCTYDTSECSFLVCDPLDPLPECGGRCAPQPDGFPICEADSNGTQGSPCISNVDCDPIHMCWAADFYCAQMCRIGEADCPPSTTCLGGGLFVGAQEYGICLCLGC